MGIPPPCQDKSLHIVAGYLAAALRHFHLCQIPFENISKNALMSEDRRALSLR